jgi:hypothetical protein
MIYYLLIFELQNKSYELSKIWIKSGLKSYLNSILNLEPTRGGFLLARTGSFGSALWIVGFKWI